MSLNRLKQQVKRTDETKTICRNETGEMEERIQQSLDEVQRGGENQAELGRREKCRQ